MSAYRYIGKKIAVAEAAQKATGQTRFTDDIKLPRMLYAKVLFSPYAHARIISIDVSKAVALPGVRAVATYLNTPQVLYNSTTRFLMQEPLLTERIFDPIVRFVGDRVAAVAADNLQIAEQALRLIKVEYEQLPYYLDVEQALAEDSLPLHGESNIAVRAEQKAGDTKAGFAQADHIFCHRYTMPPVHHGAIETHTAIANYDAEGKLTVISPFQNVFGQRIVLSRIFSLPMSKVRVISPSIGGGFGGKMEASLEPVAAALSILSKQPVKLTYNRRESMVSTRTRHGAVVELKTGVMKDGAIIAQEFKVLTNTGAYAASAANVLRAMSNKVFKLYRTTNLSFEGQAVYTNLPVAGAMRGYGSPQVFFAQQCQMQIIAKALNMDIVELQLKNLIDPDGVDQRDQITIGNPRPKDCLLRALELQAQWPETDDKNGKYKFGVGLAVGIHGNGAFGAHLDQTSIIIKMNDDGSCVLYTGSHEMGQSTLTLQKQILCEVLDIPLDMVATVYADTDACPWSLGDFTSRGAYVSGYAVKDAALLIKNALLDEAALLFNEERADLLLQNSGVYSPKSQSWRSLAEIIDHAQNVSRRDIIVSVTHPAAAGPGSYGVHIARVRINQKSGEIAVSDYIAVHDLGFAINRLSSEGQVEGAIQMGIGYALQEELLFDELGKCSNASLRKYKMIRATQMPHTQIDFIEKGEPSGPFGAKSLAECALVPCAPAVINAVANALDQEIYTLPFVLK